MLTKYILRVVVFLNVLSVDAEAKVFYLIGSTTNNPTPWRNCYTGSPEEAFSDLKTGKFIGGNDIEIQNLKIINRSVTFDPIYFGQTLSKASLTPCVFTDKDTTETKICKITIQTPRSGTPVTMVNSYLPLIEEDWRKKGFSGKLIDCKNARQRIIRNTWRQPLRLDGIKLMTEIVQKYNMPLINIGTGFVNRRES